MCEYARMRCKKTFDARTLSHQALEQVRRSAVQRVEAGESPEFVGAGVGLNRRTIYRWLAAYHAGGVSALKAKPIPGAPTKLTAAQMARLARIVCTKTPQQLKFEYALWTWTIIRDVIRRQFGVRLSEVSVGRLMGRLGFTPQRPLYRAWQQDPILVERWRTEAYPAIVAKAKREGAAIFFADESGVRSDAHAGTTWGLKGTTPVVKTTGARFGFNMISAVNANGQCRFMIIERRVTAVVFCEFLRRLLQGMTRKIILIVDGHPTHKAKRVQRFLAAQAGRLELYVLPPYSPDLNPDELAWAHVKGKLGRGAAQTKTELNARAHGILRSLQQRPQRVRSFFHAPSCAYAAA